MPYSLSEEQIDFILSDIKARGIEIEKLQINLLDHVCCLLEERMNEGDDFEAVYDQIISEFHESGLKGLQKETKGVTCSKYYYSFRVILYIIFAGSITYNIYVVSKIVHEIKHFREEFMTIKDVTLKEGYEHLNTRLKEEYPDSVKKDLTCVFFIGRPDKEEDFRRNDTPFFMKKFWIEDTGHLHKKMDSLAVVYHKNVTFISAFERTDNLTEYYMFERSIKYLNLFYLTGMNRLFSAYNNEKHITYKSYPTIFVLNKDGKLIYDGQYAFERIDRLNRFLKAQTK